MRAYAFAPSRSANHPDASPVSLGAADAPPSLQAAEQAAVAVTRNAPAQIDAVPAFGSQVVLVAAETHVHHVLVAHLLHELDRRHEVAVLRAQQGELLTGDGEE